MTNISLVTLVVDDYDRAIDFYTRALGFTLLEDAPSETNDGRPKRWVVVGPDPTRGGTNLLLAQADGERQQASVGNQTGGRVGFFLRVDDFDAAFAKAQAAGATVISAPREMPYGTVAVISDYLGNCWDILGPDPR